MGRVKALLTSKRDRIEQGLFVAEGLQGVREALQTQGSVETLFLTKAGMERLAKAGVSFPQNLLVEVSERVAEAMSDAMTTQGIIAVCRIPNPDLTDLTGSEALRDSHLIFLNEIQDPGNAGTILRTADAMGISAIITSPGSVDFYSPKVVRATAGSLWHVSLFLGVDLAEVRRQLPNHQVIILDGSAKKSFAEVELAEPAIWIFGNEARGMKEDVSGATHVSIPMPGRAESLNLAAAAAIVMHEISRK